jgi:hypothetical protein
MTVEPIRGRVARILNAREVALNIGSRDGVQVGMHFDILDPKGQDIHDPDTRELLGSIERPKIRVEVKEVEERLSVASTLRSRKENIGGVGTMADLGRLFQPPHWVTVYETFKSDEHAWEDLDEKDSLVKTGDPVVQVTSKEPERQGSNATTK